MQQTNKQSTGAADAPVIEAPQQSPFEVHASLEDVPYIITAQQIEAWELIAKDTRKEFSYYKETGKWNWHNRGESGHQHGPFQTRLDALFDAVEPYTEQEGAR